MMNNKKYAPPWKLAGEGYIVPFFNTKKIENRGLIKELKNLQKSKIGALIIVKYYTSNVGPYDEILFIPGKFRFINKLFYSISKIFVSTKKSVLYGKSNWGIPKNLANFNFEKISSNKEKISVKTNKNNNFEICFTCKKLKFPVNTKFFNTSLLHIYNNKKITTTFSAKGFCRLAKIDFIKQNGDFLPLINNINPKIAFKIENIELEFNEGKIYGN